MLRGIVLAFLVAVCLMGAATAVADEKKVKVLDDCDPTDPNYIPIGGCELREGDVNVAERLDFRFSRLMLQPFSFVIGHPAWRNEPSYLKIKPDTTVKVKNEGGRVHTFTRVANFGGGTDYTLNAGLSQARECLDATKLDPGDSIEVTGLNVGNHRFQCCIHPWMRSLIKVIPGNASTNSAEER